jgi:HEPN domain-containing protein
LSEGRVAYWVDLADYDLETAEAMLATERLLYVGFMCHQTIEKLLKGYYVSKDSETPPPHTHNLTRLSNMSGLYQEMSEEQKDFLDTLEPLNIEARYPTDKGLILKSLSQAKCRGLLEATKEMAQWIKSLL